MRSSSLRLAAAFATATFALAHGPQAYANGRFPAASQIVPAPGDPSTLVMRATFGILISRDAGKSWDWVCEGAVGYDTNEDPTLAVTTNGTVLAGAFKGMFASRDTGCSWAGQVGSIGDPVVDIVVRKDDPKSAFAITAAYAGAGDAGTGTFTSKVWVTSDDGANFAPVGQPLDPTVLPETIDVAPSNPQRLYVSGTIKTKQGDGGTHVTGVILSSTNGGVQWTQSTFDMLDTELAPFIAAVDPLDAERFYVRVKGTAGTRVLVTTNGGATLTPVWQAKGDLLGFALSSDGSKIYAGGPIDGMNVASKADMTFTQKATTQIQCLAVQGATLLACSNEASGFIVGSSTNDGATFAPLLHLSCVRGPLACAATSPVTTVCGPLWAAQQDALGGACVTGAGDGGSGSGSGSGSGGGNASGSGSGGASGSGSGGGSSGGCALTSEPAALRASPFVAAGIGVLALGVARRRRRRAGATPR